jgi:hypothetical protein
MMMKFLVYNAVNVIHNNSVNKGSFRAFSATRSYYADNNDNQNINAHSPSSFEGSVSENDISAEENVEVNQGILDEYKEYANDIKTGIKDLENAGNLSNPAQVQVALSELWAFRSNEGFNRDDFNVENLKHALYVAEDNIIPHWEDRVKQYENRAHNENDSTYAGSDNMSDMDLSNDSNSETRVDEEDNESSNPAGLEKPLVNENTDSTGESSKGHNNTSGNNTEKLSTPTEFIQEKHENDMPSYMDPED